MRHWPTRFGQTDAVRARDLLIDSPLVGPTTPAQEALRVLATAGRPGLVVRDGERYTVVPASQVLRLLLPRYVLDDPSLGRVFDEAGADDLVARVRDRTVGELIAALDRPDDAPEPTVDPDATSVEIAAVMSSARVPMVAVVDRGRYIGVVTVARLVEHLLA